MTDNSWIYEEAPITNYLTIVYKPVYFEGSVPVYSRSDVDLYGLPDYYGIGVYLVTDNVGQDYVADHKFEIERRGSLRPIHRYSHN